MLNTQDDRIWEYMIGSASKHKYLTEDWVIEVQVPLAGVEALLSWVEGVG